MGKKMKPNDIVTAPYTNSAIFLDRELSLLAFNRRVLAQAEDKTLPLLERLRYQIGRASCRERV